jgi:hypothetical protein
MGDIFDASLTEYTLSSRPNGPLTLFTNEDIILDA